MKTKLFLLVFLAALIGAAYYISTGHFSSGERAGTVSKLSEKGYIFKTEEGVFNEGGYSGGTGTLTPKYWDFSAKSDSIVVKLKQALATGERVTLTYEEKFLQLPWNGDTKYFITDVLFLNKPKTEGPTLLESPAAAVQTTPEAPAAVQVDSVKK